MSKKSHEAITFHPQGQKESDPHKNQKIEKDGAREFKQPLKKAEETRVK